MAFTSNDRSVVAACAYFSGNKDVAPDSSSFGGSRPRSFAILAVSSIDAIPDAAPGLAAGVLLGATTFETVTL